VGAVEGNDLSVAACVTSHVGVLCASVCVSTSVMTCLSLGYVLSFTMG